MNARGIRAGAAYIELFAEDSKLVRGLQRAEKRLKAFGAGVREIGTKLAGLGAAVVAPLAGAAKVFADAGSRLWDMSKRTGVSVEALSILGYAAEQAGASTEDLEKGLRKMQNTITDAAQGSASAQEALARLGLTVKDLAGLSPEEQFRLIGDRLDRIADPTLKAATAMDIFGRAGTGLLPMLEGGAAALDAYAAQARRLGLVISTEDAQAADAFGDALADLWKVLRQGAFTIGAALAPALKDLAERLTSIVVTASQWIGQNREVVVTVLQVAAGVAAAGVALVVAGYAISGLAAIFGAVAAVITGVGTAIGILGSVLAAILSPIGLVIAAVAALGAYILHATGAAAKALGWLGERFAALKDDAMTAYGGIADALAAGDIGLAAKILWLTLKMEWQKGVQVLLSAWLKFKDFFIRIAYGAFYGALAAMEIVWHGLEVAWIESVALLSQTWERFTAGVATAWATVVNLVTKGINWIRGLWDDAFDAEAANLSADKALVEQERKIGTESAAALAKLERERAGKRERSASVHDATMAEIGRQYNEQDQRLQDEYQAKMQASEEALAKARADWQQAIADAAAKRQAKESADGGPGGIESADDVLGKMRGSLSGLGDLLDQAGKRTIGAAGTFNVASLLGLQAGGADDRIANATERTAKGIDGLRQDVKNNRPAFT